MEELLRQLLNRLGRIGNEYEELHDSECPERMSDAVINRFVRASPNYELPHQFGLHSAGANRAVRNALLDYIDRASIKASELGLDSFHDRLAAFQNPDIPSDDEGLYFDDYFGYMAGEQFDAAGNVIDLA
jgi:hypothetical protein